MNLTEYNSALAVSCIEKYFIPWFERHCGSTDALLCGSYISADKLLKDFRDSSASFETYTGIPRLQEVAEELGMTERRLYSEIPEDIDFTSLNLVRVKPIFFAESKISPWRGDHYIMLIGNEKKGYRYINSYPLFSDTISKEKLKELFGGSYLVYRKTGPINTKKLKAYEWLQTYSIMCKPEEPEDRPISPIKLRDALAVLKISRKRLLQWLLYMDATKKLPVASSAAEALKKLISTIEKAFLSTEVLIKRNMCDAADSGRTARFIALESSHTDEIITKGWAL